MSTVVLTSHSVGTPHEQLAKFLRPNKEAYCRARGYELVNLVVPYDKSGHLAVLEYIKIELKAGNTILSVGADVIFTNFAKGVEDFEPFPVTLAQENLRWWPINNDVMIWNPGAEIVGTKMATTLVWELISDAEIWLKYPWLWQNHLWNLICTDEQVRLSVNIVPARRMNSTPYPGLSQWQLGDWICHLLDMPIEKKLELAPFFLKMAGNGTFYPPT